jgi:glycosyltransferase involved in cell wall biosynthesis
VGLVSVIMPARDAAATLGAAIASVRAQTFGDWELLIADDASTDATFELAAAAAAADSRIRALQVGGVGPAGARNAALERAGGRFAAFLDADDLWLAPKLAAQVELHRASGAALTYTAYERLAARQMGPSGPLPGARGRLVAAPPELTWRRLLGRNLIGNLTAMVDRQRVALAPQPDRPGAEDWALWLDVARRAEAAGIDPPARGIGQALAIYRAGAGHSRRRLRAARAVWRVLRDQGLAAPSAGAYLASNLVRGLIAQRG